MSDFDEAEELLNGILVNGPGGSTFWVMRQEEQEYFLNSQKKYMEHNAFKNMSDLAELDRILVLETMMYRWGLWLSKEHDYNNEPINIEYIQRYYNDASREVRQLKKSIGIDKPSRDKARGEGLAEYLTNLANRAKAFGYMRNEQMITAITLFNRLKAEMILYQNTDEQEKDELRRTPEEVIKWIIEYVIPEFDKIDEWFTANKNNPERQQLWVQDM